ALHEEECQPIMRAREPRIYFKCSPVGSHRLFQPTGARERDRHVLQHAQVVWRVTERESVRRQRGIVITLTLQHQRLVKIVESLRAHVALGLAAEQAAQPGHFLERRSCEGFRHRTEDRRWKTEDGGQKPEAGSRKPEAESRSLQRVLHPSGTAGAPAEVASKMPRKKPVRPAKEVFNVDWPLFGELSRALALQVAREYDPDVVVGI